MKDYIMLVNYGPSIHEFKDAVPKVIDGLKFDRIIYGETLFNGTAKVKARYGRK